MEKSTFFSYNRFLREKFNGPVLKIPLSGGFTCPNIDGRKGTGGCIYCDNRSFSPVAETKDHIEEQLRAGIARSPKRFEKYIAYFQPYSNTYGTVEQLRSVYEPIFNFPEVVGIAIGTRPDCFDEEIYAYMEELHERTYLSVELGLQTVHDKTLIKINRCQTHQDGENAILEFSKRGIETVAHIMLGLPGETKEMMMETARVLADLPVEGIKLHQLMIIKHTPMEKMYKNNKVSLLSLEEYADLVEEFLSLLRPDQHIHRLMADCTWENGLVAPDWAADKIRSLDYIQKKVKYI